ncbi:MAG: hypothetical protein COA74_03715 [Gammaproteobacteria bacterium]|nr:MAG: hypothetical protein COA74_03715 [Gammaproteobacteria bacterium]
MTKKLTHHLKITKEFRAKNSLICFYVALCLCLFIPGTIIAFSNLTGEQASYHANKVSSFNLIAIENGLSDNNINKVLQDQSGFIWFATKHGLSRYDGFNIKSYFHSLSRPDSISSNSVETIYQDHQGTIWVGTLKGLNRLNTRESGFILYYSNQQQATSLSNNNITAINQDQAHRLWIGTANGINLLIDEKRGNFKHYLVKDAKSEEFIKINFIEPYNSTILAGTTKGLYEYNKDSDSFNLYPFKNTLLVNSYHFITSFVDSKETIWLAVKDVGVFFKSKTSSEFKKFNVAETKTAETEIVGELSTKDVSAISEDSNGNIWFGSSKEGLLIYYPEIKVLSSIQLNINSKNSILRKPSIQNIIQDASGLMWVGTESYGVLQWSPKTLHVKHYNEFALGVDNMSLDAMVWDFHEDDKGNIWIASYGGIKIFNPNTGIITPISIKRSGEKSEPEVYSITRENDHYWFATNNSLIRYKPNIGVIERITIDGNPEFSLPKNTYIKGVAYLDNVLYLAIEGQDLYAFDIVNRTHKKITLKGEGLESPSSKSALSVIKSLDEQLWILTADGLFKYNPIEDKIVLAISEGISQLSNNYISSLFEESVNSIWLGTSGYGINHLSIEEDGSYKVDQFQQYPELRHQIVNGLLLDKETPANLWISTHSGIFQLNRTTNSMRHFTVEDGVQTREFNEGAYYLDKEGHIYFGAVNGFIRLNPLRFTTNTYEPPLRIIHFSASCSIDTYPCEENFAIKNLSFSCEGTDCANKKINPMAFPYELEHLEITFTSLDYTSPLTNKYRYRLYADDLYNSTAEDIDWVHLLNKNSIVFNELKSSNYTLEIQGSNSSGLWSNRIARLDFSVATPWYRNKYMYLIQFIVVLFTVYLIISRRRFRYQEEKRVSLVIKKSEESFKFALWGSGDELWEWLIPSDLLIRTNQTVKYAKSRTEASNTMNEFVECIHPDDRKDTVKLISEHIRGKSVYYESFFRVLNTSGNYIWVLSRGRVVDRDENKKAIRILGSIKDITLIKATEDKLKLIAKAFETTMDGISILDPSFKAVLNNHAFYKITSLTTAEAINKQYFFSEESENHDKFQQILITLRNFGEWEGELWETRANGDKFAIELKIDKVVDDNRQVSNYICIFSDITYRKRSEDELRKLANYDSLTQLPNRSLFIDRLNQAIASAKRSESKFALLFIDLDHFKTINDSLGHSIGDELLRKVAQRLTRCVRDADTVARLGGDEFVIILENIHNVDEVGACADKIIRRMQKSIEISGTVLKTSPSIGIGIYPNDGLDRETLIKNSDIAMYSAKQNGRNNYQFFTADMTSSAVEKLNIQNKLIEAIDKNQLELYYQPKVYSDTGELTGFEALIRWIHPEDGMISPAAFIPVAEESGLIIPIGEWVLAEAISQAKKWSEINADCCAIAINLSARQFQQENLSEIIADLLNQYDLDPKYIELEITEGTLMSNMEHAISTLNTLRDMGICLSLDDFGTGYSSLSYLKRFPVNKLKVDQSFVRDITIDPGDASIVASIISLAHNLGLKVIAEGCETLEQLSFICSYNCEEVQGYLFSRPLPRAKAEEILKKGKIIIER